MGINFGRCRRWLWLGIKYPLILAVVLLLSLWGVWCSGAVFYTVPGGAAWHGALTMGTTLLLFFGIGYGCRRHWVWLIVVALELGVSIHFARLTPEQVFRDAVWQKPWGRSPAVTIKNGIVTVHDVRDFDYRSEHDYDVRYRTVSFPLDEVRTLDLAVSHWDGLQDIAHTMLSFGFADGRHLALSMETRLPEGVSQNFLGGLYKQYELLDIFGTEEDLFRLRTDFRKEELYLYRTNATPEQVKRILRLALNRAALFHEYPRFYNSITRNCTTSLAPLLEVIDPGFTGDIRLLLNGYSDKMLYDLGYLAHRDGESFEELKERRRVDRYLNAENGENYSSTIRTDL